MTDAFESTQHQGPDCLPATSLRCSASLSTGSSKLTGRKLSLAMALVLVAVAATPVASLETKRTYDKEEREAEIERQQNEALFDPWSLSPTERHRHFKPATCRTVGLFYTDEARRNQVEGILTALLTVGSLGDVVDVRVTQGLPFGISEKFTRGWLAPTHWAGQKCDPAIFKGEAVKTAIPHMRMWRLPGSTARFPWNECWFIQHVGVERYRAHLEPEAEHQRRLTDRCEN